MIRELIDTALLEDFAEGIGRASGLRVAIYDVQNTLIAASHPIDERTGQPSPPPAELPPHPLRQTPTDEDARVGLAFVELDGGLLAIAAVYMAEEPAGYVAVMLPPGAKVAGEHAPMLLTSPLGATAAIAPAPLALAEERSGDAARALVTVRWAARLLSAWCRRESRIHAAAEELGLIGDIAELLTGEQSLQEILNQIVTQTARVMKCQYCSLRLYNPRTDELTTAAVHRLSQRYLEKGAILRRQNPIDDLALHGEVVYVEDAARDPRFRHREEARREGIVSGLTAGMIYRGQPIGVLRVYTTRRQRFRSMQRYLLKAVASQGATAIVHARLVEQRLRQAALEREVQLAGKVQARMIPRDAPTHPAVEIARIFEPSSHLGGDFCDFVRLADGRLAAVVADVSGKGVPASLIMASTRGALRALCQSSSDLGEILRRLNLHVLRETSDSEFVTLLMVALEPDGRRATFASGGHEPLLLLRGGQLHSYEEGGLVLGIDPQETYQTADLPLEPGDTLLLYTDGVIDAMNFEQEHFGRQRLADALRNYGANAPAALLRNILWDIRRFVGLAEQTDDLTLVGLRVHDRT